MNGEESEASSTTSSKDQIPGFGEIQVIEVNRENFQQVWPFLLVSVKASDIISLDLELSGLGGKGLRSKDVGERYQAIKEAAQTRSVLSLGICTMKLVNKSEKKKRMKYQCQVFNILTLSTKPFTIEPEALKFLATHSFDFNRLIQSGVPFQGNNCPLQVLFREIFGTSASVCLHNGLIDLAFIHQQFYCVDLPDTLDEFCNNLADLFPSDYLPIVDSKYLAEYSTRMNASYLEYVFRRSQGDNEIERQNRRYYVEIEFPNSENMMKCLKDATEKVDCKLPIGFPFHPIPIDLHNHVCRTFGNHGFCHSQRKGDCPKLHDTDFAIDVERCKENKKAFKRKRRYSNVIAGAVAERIERAQEEFQNAKFNDKIKVKDVKDQKQKAVNGLHRAGVDAFMTAFAVVYQQRKDLMENNCIDKETLNRIPLSAKDTPLFLRHRQNIVPSGDAPLTPHQCAMVEIEKMRSYVRENAAKK